MMSNLSSYGRGVSRQAFSSSEKLVRLGKVRPASLVGYRPSDPACLACVHPTFPDSGTLLYLCDVSHHSSESCLDFAKQKD